MRSSNRLTLVRRLAVVLLSCHILGAVSCAPALSPPDTATPTGRAPFSVTLVADGETRQLTSTGATVADVLREAGISLGPADEIDPPAMTLIPATASATTPLTITIVRVTETMEVIPESIPFGRRVIRSAEMSPDDPPRIVQTGTPGLREVTVRIVFRDGLEAERWPTATTIVEPAVDEIVMIGVGARQDALPLAGLPAYIDDGRAVVLEAATDSPRQLAVEGALDGRVFQLSPDGGYLLYTTGRSDGPPGSFSNELWVIATAEGATPRPLQIENVLWAGWDPAAVGTPRVAYTTARSTTLPPGWEANNDLWLLSLPPDGVQPAPIRLVETYPTTYGWWGGNYTWSPDGSRLAYAFADEIGLLTMPAGETLGDATVPETQRTTLHTFAPFDTGADWAWVPPLSWSADGRFLAFIEPTDGGERFDLRRLDTSASAVTTLTEGAGMWSVALWSPPTRPDTRLASFRLAEPGDEESGYVLSLSDGGTGRRFFPPDGELGSVAPAPQSLAWGPDGDTLAFIFDDALYFLDVTTGETTQPDLDDTTAGRLTWAPYGAAATP